MSNNEEVERFAKWLVVQARTVIFKGLCAAGLLDERFDNRHKPWRQLSERERCQYRLAAEVILSRYERKKR